MTTEFNTSISTSSTGAKLCIYELPTPLEPKAIIQINHGMAEHAARYNRFANALAGAGYHVIAHDHRGHGKTTAPDAPLGVFSNENGLQKALQDIHHVNALAKEKYPDLPVVLFGHSMGTILGFNYCLHHADTISGAALWNAGFDTGLLPSIGKILIKLERMFKGSDVPSALAVKLTFEDWNKKFAPNRTDFDWLSRDEDEVDKYVADPLCGFPVSIGMWLSVMDAVFYGGNDQNLKNLPADLPFHLQAGASDPCSNNGKAVEALAARLQKHGVVDLTLNLLPDTRHESLNEINRDQTTANFIQWLDQHFG